jgi:hypothetical protein
MHNAITVMRFPNNFVHYLRELRVMVWKFSAVN